jgi:DNA-binding protein HU-beta
MFTTDLIDVIAEETKVSKAVVARILDAGIDAIQVAVAAGDKVTLTGFGVFEAAYKPARDARNPRTGEPVKVAAGWGPKFRPGSKFKDQVNTGARAQKAA